MLLKQILAFRPSRLDLIFALKTFIAGMLALFVSFELDLINPMWSIGTVLIIANPYSGMVSSKCVYRVVGTIGGAVIALTLTPHLINTPWIFTVVLSLWVGFALYVSLLDRTPRSYAFMLAGYSTAMIVFNAITYIDQYNIFDIALARVIEISIGVISSAVVSATILPMHIGSAIKQRVIKTLKDTENLFANLLNTDSQQNNTQLLAAITRDTTDIHALAVHLSYEKGELHGMTKPLQEMLHQISMVVANLVALSERIKQLKELRFIETHAEKLQQLSAHVVQFLEQKDLIVDENILQLPDEFESDFASLMESASTHQQVLVAAMKMDVRHFISNVLAVKVLWQRIQQGNKEIPDNITPMTTKYPSLHRDHGVAIRGGISAVLITFIVTGVWIVSGWKAGFMMAQMGAVTACILTALDNPVPVLRIFIWGSIASAVLVFVYAFGIFPHVTTFWELGLVLLPMFLFAVSMMANQMLMPVGMVLGINTMMGLNLHNAYSMDAVSYLDSSFAMILGVLVSLIVIDVVRAMSPDTSASRILALHYRAMRKAIYLPYGLDFKVHLRSMLDRIGILNSKMVQSDEIKTSIHQALIESSSIVDLSRLQELANQFPQASELTQHIGDLQQNLDELFRAKENDENDTTALVERIYRALFELKQLASNVEDMTMRQRLLISLNNIAYSMCHVSSEQMNENSTMKGATANG
ncbi:FUSC family protein [Acinetobacter pittii]|uniref:FUSC family protein n=1 Tax=Acinetobacter TaxID=469 RepID=UPI0001CF7F81|nr:MULTISPECIES: FUSC family protein [Acinetobacter]KCY69816.1 fusaric acid resistance family protein [Acinetobacter baumannii 1288284]AZB97401.1 FUSC family protein [Acinetobacter pittii]EFF85713.1 fusaric acid resistance protein conserved region [Acinetobacter sp. SH024]EXB76606.1 fusaric acid resistance family protein [Acinetobacter sp. 1475718]EXI16827.1 fusaric acid resistance family protein [Acinetobacter sp. 723929]